MTSTEVPVDVRWRIALAPEDQNVAAFCREYGIARPTFYFWRDRFEREGPSGLTSRSRAPKRSPGRIAAGVEDAIVALRKELTELGVDGGPATIQWHLARQHLEPVPSEATIWRVLTRRGFIEPQPQKRP